MTKGKGPLTLREVAEYLHDLAINSDTYVMLELWSDDVGAILRDDNSGPNERIASFENLAELTRVVRGESGAGDGT